MIDQAANAALAGALVIHVFAAIISFLAAFFLIRYKLSAAKREERKLEKQQKQKQKEKEREKEVPYDERHKRKWEQFIEDEDQAGNSITHRRIVREMDALPVDEHVELDY